MANVLVALGQVKDIIELVNDAKKILQDVIKTEIERNDIPVHCDLAASFGTLNKDSIRTIDEELKIIIAGTTRAISNLKDRSWKELKGCMLQNVLLEPIQNSEVTRSDRLFKSGRSAFKFDGSPDLSVMNEVNAWFTKLIGDPDVLKDTKIDIDFMAKVVAATGATIDSFVTFFFKKIYYEKTMVDIGILRYPDIDHPYFKLYRIELKAWSDCSRILFVQDDKNGISGQFNSVKFGPRESMLKSLTEKTRSKAIQEAENLFAN